MPYSVWKTLLCCLACLLIVLSSPGQGGGRNALSVVAPREGSPEHPLRVIWVEAGSAELRSRENCEKLIARLREINIDDVFVEVRLFADAYYDSDIAVAPTDQPKEFADPLEAILELAHAKGSRALRVHAVLNLLRLYNETNAFPPPENHLLLKRPDWVSLRYDGGALTQDRSTYLDPAVPEVQRHLQALVAELVKRYAVDGVHLVELRYPGTAMEWGYNPLSLRQFELDMDSGGEKPDPGNLEWARWRAGQLTLLLEQLRTVIRRERPGIILSVSAVASGPVPSDGGPKPDFEGALQYWPLWCREGLVDWLVLANYRAHQAAPDRFVRWIDYARTVQGKAKMVVGIAGSKNFDSHVLMQVRLALGREAEGVMLRSYQKPALNLLPQTDFLGFLGRTVFSPRYVLPSYAREAILASAPPRTDVFPDFLPPEDLPPPIPLAELRSAPPEKIYTQEDAARALLAGAVASSPIPLAELVEDEIEQPFADDVFAEADFAEFRWLVVSLNIGTQFVGRHVSDDGVASIFKTRDGGNIITLANSKIKQTRPLEPGE